MPNPTVSICCLTFNHAKYIEKTINAFLMQKTTFEIEIIIHDDASTDNTQNIIKALVGDDVRFKLILRSDNLKSKGEIISPILFNKARGKYIAMCDGDDYWTDPFKLQKQVDFLENNVHYGLVHTDYDILYENSGRLINASNQTNNNIYNNLESDFNQLLLKNHVATLSVLFRKDLLQKIDIRNLDRYRFGDLPLWFELSQLCRFKYFSKSSAVYRKRIFSISNNSNKLKRFEFVIESKKIKMDYAGRFGSSSQRLLTEDEYYKCLLIMGFHTLDKLLVESSYKKIHNRGSKVYIIYVLSKLRYLNMMIVNIKALNGTKIITKLKKSSKSLK